MGAAASPAALIGRIEACSGGALVAALTAAVAVNVDEPWVTACFAVTVVALLSAAVESLFLVPLAIRNFRVEIVSTGVLIHRGALFRSIDHVPRSKITVVRRQEGPLLRRLGVAKCVLFTPAREVVLLPMSVPDVERMMELGSHA